MAFSSILTAVSPRRVACSLCVSLIGAGAIPAFASPAIEGKVVNHVTGVPIPEAFVIATWSRQGSDGFGSRTSCVAIEIVRSDATGRFLVPPKPGAVDVDVYKPGFDEYFAKRAWNSRQEMEQSWRVREMVPVSGSAEEREQQLRTYGWYLECRSKDITAALSPLFHAMDEESAALNLPRKYVKALEERDELVKQKAAREARKPK